jgi:hypothetical protein
MGAPSTADRKIADRLERSKQLRMNGQHPQTKGASPNVENEA